MTFEKREETKKIKLTTEMEEVCQAIDVQNRVSAYETFPAEKTDISPCKVFHSPLAKRPMTEKQVATNAVKRFAFPAPQRMFPFL